MNTLHTVAKTLIFTGLALCVPGANAHNFQAVLPSAPDAFVKISTTCYRDSNGDTAKYMFQIKSVTTSAPYRVQLSMQKQLDNGQIIRSDPVVDPINGDQAFSDWGELDGGNGAYVWTVSKVPAGANGGTQGPMVFSVEHHCQSASGAHTGTDDPVKLPSSPDDPPDNPGNPVDPTKPTTPSVASFSGALSKSAIEKTYLVTCSPNKNKATAKYWFSILAATKNRPFSVGLTVSKEGSETSVSDPSNADKIFGDYGFVEGGEGTYKLVVRKQGDTGALQGTMAFKVKHSCEASDGTRTKTSKPKVAR